jgi:hypothetical protein
LPNWSGRQRELARFEDSQLFFIGGAPRSGTTWLQQMLDSHPDISCRGEGLFLRELAIPMERLMGDRTRAVGAKNQGIFRDYSGYPLPAAEDTEFLIGTAVLLALQRQTEGKPYRAVGEKTPENVFFFPRLKALFPRAKLIGLARDPRDVLTSAWHFFRRLGPGEDEVAAKTAFIRTALPSLVDGARAMLALSQRQPEDCVIVTYEALLQATGPGLAKLFAFLGVPATDEIVSDCLARTSFAAMFAAQSDRTDGARPFLRKGVVGDWRSTLTPEMNDLILRELGWMFPHFGWVP